MPSIPKWLGNTMEKLSGKFFHPVEVTQIEYYTSGLKRVRLEGDLRKTAFIAGNVVEFRISDTEYRHYTPSYYDTVNGICDIVFYLHDCGEGSRWAEALDTGDKVKLIGPGNRMNFRPEFREHFVFGDETSLGLMTAIETASKEEERSFFGLAELDREHLFWTDFFKNTGVKAVESSMEHPAGPAIAMLEEWEPSFWEVSGDTCFYLTGRAKSIQSMRKYLLSKGISGKRIYTYPYWAEGKKGL